MRWTKNLEKDLGGKIPGWKYSESPLVDGDKLICTPGAKDAAEGVMKSAFGLQGQKCSANSRIFVENAVKDKLLAKILDKTRAIAIGDPTEVLPNLTDASPRFLGVGAPRAGWVGVRLMF